MLLTVVYGQTDVLTQHNDLNRTGWNNTETILNTTNVNTNSFGRVALFKVDDQVVAQPLVVTGVMIGGIPHNIVYIATTNNSIYAYDADDTVNGGHYYWTKNYTQSSILPASTYQYRPPNNNDMFPDLCNGQYKDIQGTFGILGTPVIAKNTNTMYFVSRSVSGDPTQVDDHAYVDHGGRQSYAYTSTGFYQVLHAIDLSTGLDKTTMNSPNLISASAPGTGDASDGVNVHFDPRRNNQRPGLVLSKGMLYIAYSSHCDMDYYHGWVLGYDSSNLKAGVGGAAQLAYNTTPNDGRGGIWMSGGAPAVDPSGSLYVSTGNGWDFDIHGVAEHADPTQLVNRGESAIKLTPNTMDNHATSLGISSYFTSSDIVNLNAQDLDMPIQMLLFPNTNYVITGIKNSNLYLMDRTTMGGYTSGGPDKVKQIVDVGTNANMHSSFAYYEGQSAKFFYQLSENTLLKAFPIGPNSLGTPIDGTVNNPIGGSGGFLSISSNGTNDASAILWINQARPYCDAIQSVCPGLLRAVKASDVTKEIYNSSYLGDYSGTFAKMACPTVANGKVYLATLSKQVAVFGLKPPPSCGMVDLCLGKVATASSSQSGTDNSTGKPLTPDQAIDGDFAKTRWESLVGQDQWLKVDLGQPYVLCHAVVNWWFAYGVNYAIEGSNDDANWTTLSSITGNASQITEHAITNTTAWRYVRLHGTLRHDDNSNGTYSAYEFSVYGLPMINPCPVIASVSATQIGQSSAEIDWPVPPGGTPSLGYTVSYKASANASFTTQTVMTNTINLTGLSCSTDYLYTVQAKCSSTESGDVATGAFTTSTCTNSCTLPTRTFSTDLGLVGVGGSSCYNSGTWTVKGSGSDIGGTSDNFQYAYKSINTDETISGRVVSQDFTTTVNNKGGLMMREAITPTSPFIYFARTNGGSTLLLESRSVDGGPTVSNTISILSTIKPFLKIQKTGTVYTAFYSLDNGVTYTQFDNALSLGFGGSGVSVGWAVTSTDNAVVSTALFDNFIEGSSPLPVTLVDFTGTNINNDYIALKWITDLEVNNAYFDVERSSDGANFSYVTKVSGVGNSNVRQYYEANDDHPYQGVNFYRLKQVDLDGKYSYSPVITVRFGKNYAPVIFPNPASSYFNVVSGNESIREIRVYNTEGKNIFNLVNENASSNFTVPVSNLSAGIYIVQIKTATQVYQQKLIKR